MKDEKMKKAFVMYVLAEKINSPQYLRHCERVQAERSNPHFEKIVSRRLTVTEEKETS